MLCNDKKLKFFKKFFFFLTKIYQFNAWLPRYVFGIVFLRRLLLRMKMELLSWGSVKNVFLRNFWSCHFWMRKNLGGFGAPEEHLRSFCAIWDEEIISQRRKKRFYKILKWCCWIKENWNFRIIPHVIFYVYSCFKFLQHI